MLATVAAAPSFACSAWTGPGWACRPINPAAVKGLARRVTHPAHGLGREQQHLRPDP
jgi:hypothetical protein